MTSTGTATTSDGGKSSPTNGSLAVDLRGVTAGYRGQVALTDVTLQVPRGAMMAIVGPNGGGKSTLLKLLLGLDRPDEGRALLDDIDLQQIPPATLRACTSVVPQEVQLFQGTIADNIAMGAVDRSPEQIVAAAQFVGLDGVVRRLPLGYATPLGDLGSGLSAGQRQLIALARAIMRNPQLLVLDEATSALDSVGERRVLDNLRKAGSGRTVVLVTHRVSLLDFCDRAIVMNEGRIVQDGPAKAIARTLQEGARPSLKVVS